MKRQWADDELEAHFTLHPVELDLVLQQRLVSSSRGKIFWLLESLKQKRPSPFFPPPLIATRDGLPGAKPHGQVAPG